MFAQYYGQYLLSKNYVNGGQLQEAVSSLKHTHVRLGVLAINEGYMTPTEVEIVNEQQRNKDMRFGELAVALGLLTEEKVELLLGSQKNAHVLLGQALIDHQVLTYDSFSESLTNYKQDHSLTDEQFSSIVNGNIDTLVSAILLHADTTNRERLSTYVALFAKNMIRFIDDSIRLELVQPNPNGYDWMFTQEISSYEQDYGTVTALGGSEAAFLQVGSIFAGETLVEADEMMEASIGELLNLHNGIYLVNLSNQGIELEITPQFAANNVIIPSTFDMLTVIRVYGSNFTFDLLVSDLTGFTAR